MDLITYVFHRVQCFPIVCHFNIWILDHVVTHCCSTTLTYVCSTTLTHGFSTALTHGCSMTLTQSCSMTIIHGLQLWLSNKWFICDILTYGYSTHITWLLYGTQCFMGQTFVLVSLLSLNCLKIREVLDRNCLCRIKTTQCSDYYRRNLTPSTSIQFSTL